jgi:hypothetical protein
VSLLRRFDGELSRSSPGRHPELPTHGITVFYGWRAPIHRPFIYKGHNRSLLGEVFHATILSGVCRGIAMLAIGLCLRS